MTWSEDRMHLSHVVVQNLCARGDYGKGKEG